MVLFLEVDGEQNWECLGWAVVHWTVHVLRTHESTTPLLKRVSYLYLVLFYNLHGSAGFTGVTISPAQRMLPCGE